MNQQGVNMKIVFVMCIVCLAIALLPQARANSRMFAAPMPIIGSHNHVHNHKQQQGTNRHKKSKQNHKIKSRQQAMQVVKEKYQAKVLSVVFMNAQGDANYKVKLLGRNGVVFYVYVDAQTGKIKRL